jgi:phosphotriesterase-related protein
MTQAIVNDIVKGVGDTGIHAGIIGEIGVSHPITPTEEKVLAAAARAHRRTGVAINVHLDIGVDASEYNHALDILENEGADLNRVVLDHFICRPDEVALCKQLTSRGCYVEFDLWGMDRWAKIYELTRGTTLEVMIASLYWFIAAGLSERILIAHDMCNQTCLRASGGYGYFHILRNLIPKFKEYGITDEQIRTFMIDNPRRLFPIQ